MTSFRSFVFIVAGMIFGAWAGGTSKELLGLFAGGMIGMLLARIEQLERKLRDRLLQRPLPRHSSPEPTPDILHRQGDQDWSAESSADRQTAPPRSSSSAETTAGIEATASTWPEAWPAIERGPARLEPSLLSRGLEYAKTWITQGNVPAKVGILVSFIGFSFLLKYAVDKNLIFLTLQARLVVAALFGLVLLTIGWRRHGLLSVHEVPTAG